VNSSSFCIEAIKFAFIYCGFKFIFGLFIHYINLLLFVPIPEQCCILICITNPNSYLWFIFTLHIAYFSYTLFPHVTYYVIVTLIIVTRLSDRRRGIGLSTGFITPIQLQLQCITMFTLYNTSVELNTRLATAPQPVFHYNNLLASLANNSSLPLLESKLDS
jgi:hypothetical protein